MFSITQNTTEVQIFIGTPITNSETRLLMEHFTYIYIYIYIYN
jgi:hypothetical protein